MLEHFVNHWLQAHQSSRTCRVCGLLCGSDLPADFGFSSWPSGIGKSTHRRKLGSSHACAKYAELKQPKPGRDPRAMNILNRLRTDFECASETPSRHSKLLGTTRSHQGKRLSPNYPPPVPLSTPRGTVSPALPWPRVTQLFAPIQRGQLPQQLSIKQFIVAVLSPYYSVRAYKDHQIRAFLLLITMKMWQIRPDTLHLLPSFLRSPVAFPLFLWFSVFPFTSPTLWK